MNWDRIEGRWKDIVGQAKAKWGKLTDDDWTTIAGKRDSLIGKVQERYGMLKDDAVRAVDEFAARIDGNGDGGEVRPPTQSLLDRERAQGEGMGQQKYGPPPSTR